MGHARKTNVVPALSRKKVEKKFVTLLEHMQEAFTDYAKFVMTGFICVIRGDQPTATHTPTITPAASPATTTALDH